jgi:hypothetical protein
MVSTDLDQLTGRHLFIVRRIDGVVAAMLRSMSGEQAL